MSYTPRIIINKKQLDEKESEIIQDTFKYPEDEAVKFISNLLNQQEFTIGGLDLITCQPELSKLNNDVRANLMTYGIEYAVEN